MRNCNELVINVTRVCGKCGTKISSDATRDICPACLLENGLGLFDEDAVAGVVDPGLDNGTPASDGKKPRRSAKILNDFGDYELLEEVGRGGQGVVYRAHQKSLNRTVALKVIGLGAWTTETHLKRFRREAEAAASLEHPRIVPIHEVGERNGQCYFSMKFVAGGQLDEVVRREPIRVRQAAELIAKMARTVHYAHEHGILHRDIKPGNILLDKNGEPHLTDFGLARLLDTQSSVTRTIDVLGTPSYMAPEQAAGETSKLSKATDVYGLGAVLYQLLTGQPPFAGGTTYETIRLLRDTEPRQPRLLNPKIDRDLSTICLKCLEKDPQCRYSSALALAEDLEHWLKHEPILARHTGFLARGRKWARRKPAVTALTGSLVVLATVLSVVLWNRESAGGPISKSIAVLPFENLNGEKGNAYLAEGIQNEILTRLATLRDLKVISRTSTAKYQSKPNDLKSVAQELGVSSILEGAVQKIGDKVRVNVQLIDPRTDKSLWTNSYDRDFEDILGVESEVSQEIAEALQANLSPSEFHVLASVWTHDSEAHDRFLRGEHEFHQADSTMAADAYDRADAFYRQALARDPNFAEAAAELARSRLWRHWFVSRLAPRELEEVKSLIDRALALAPNSPEAHFALGLFFYLGHRQYEKALTEFNRTLELQSNNSLARFLCAGAYRRRGEWERSLAFFKRAEEIDPRDAQIPANIAATYLALRLWKDADKAALQAFAIDPHNTVAATILVLSHLYETGDATSARQALNDFPEAIKSLTTTANLGGANVGGDAVFIIGLWSNLDVMERRFNDAFKAFEKQESNTDVGHLKQLVGGAVIHMVAGQTEAAKTTGEEARPLLEAKLQERADDIVSMTQLSWVYLALGRNADALRLSRQAADLMPVEKDAFAGPYFQIGLAQIEARAGAPEEAIERLRHLLFIPAGHTVSIARLKVDPLLDPIRNRSDFQQLLSGPERIGPNKE